MLLGDEMFSDTYKIKLVDDVLYEVYGKVHIYTYKVFFFFLYRRFVHYTYVLNIFQLVTRKAGELNIAGFNPSAEEADEGTDEMVESGVDVVLNHRLQETFAFGDKKSYTLYLKDYMKK